MRLYDLSVPLWSGLPIYEGDPATVVEPWSRLADGALAEVSRLALGSHTGTHVDAPAHFLLGARTIDTIDLGACIGPSTVVDLGAAELRRIDRASLEATVPPGADRILLKTSNSARWKQDGVRHDFVALAEDAAEWLAGRGTKLVGIDYLSIAPYDDPGPVHRILLRAGVVILEGLDFSGVPAGAYTLVCLPLRIAGADGAPARAVLIEEEGNSKFPFAIGS